VWVTRRVMSGRPPTCPVLGTVGVAEAPGSRAGRRPVAQRSRSDPWGWRGGPGNLRRANHTITDVTGRGNTAPVIGGGIASPGGAPVADSPDGAGRIVRSPSWCGWSGGQEPLCGSGLPAGQGEGEAATGEHRHGDQRLSTAGHAQGAVVDDRDRAHHLRRHAEARHAEHRPDAEAARVDTHAEGHGCRQQCNQQQRDGREDRRDSVADRRPPIRSPL